ncbi:MAG: tetratricopeptide repeat protein, partial [Desulfomonilaceae bacterium]
MSVSGNSDVPVLPGSKSRLWERWPQSDSMLLTITKIAAVVIITCSSLLFLPVDSTASQELEQGLTAARSGQLDRAVRLWSRAIRKNPKSYAAYINRGSAYIRSGHILSGILDWHKAREFSPAFAYASYGGDFIGEASGDPAMLNYAMSTELDPDFVPSVVMAGITYLDLGRSDKALELYRNSIDLTKNPLFKSFLDYWITSIESP